MIKLINPAIAPPPNKVEELPFIISICFRSSGGTCTMLRLPEKPEYNGKPSFNNCVYLPSRPWMRNELFALAAEVCWTCIPVLSLSTIEMLEGSIVIFSSISSPAITSTRVGSLPISLDPLVDATEISSSSSASDSSSTSNISNEDRGKVMLIISSRYPINENLIL